MFYGLDGGFAGDDGDALGFAGGDGLVAGVDAAVEVVGLAFEAVFVSVGLPVGV